MKREQKPLNPETEIRRRRIRLADRRAAWALFRKALILGLAVFILFGVFFGMTPMKGGDMKPKYAAGDLLLYYRLYDDYVRGDVVIMEREGSQYIGRIAGMPGDVVEITADTGLTIDGNRVSEPEIYAPTEPIPEATGYPLTLGPEEYFILGDNRSAAKDSRYFGAVKGAELKGKVITVIRRTDL